MATRVDGLLIERTDEELLVFNPAGYEAHALNSAAAIVFDLCDGSATRAEMSAALERSGLPADRTVIELALAELVDAGLVVDDDALIEDATDSPERITRRTIIRRLELSAIAIAMLPVVETIIMPQAAAAASGPLAPDMIPIPRPVTSGPPPVSQVGAG